MKIRNKRFLQSNNHAIQSMNVSLKDKSQHQLNYYARNSHKLNRFIPHNVSPLTTTPSSHRNSTKSFHLSSVRPVSIASYTPHEQDYVLNSSKNQILIEEEDSAEILIDEGQSDDRQIEESHLSSLEDEQSAQSSLGSVFYSDIKEEEWIGLALSKRNNGGSNIKIEDDQSVEEQIIFNEITVEKDLNKDSNEQKKEQGLVRQFTFAHQLSEQNASDYSSNELKQEVAISEGKSQNQGMNTPVAELNQLNSSENQQQNEGFNSSQKTYVKLQNDLIISNPKSMMLLIIEEDNESERIQQYQSPKFSTFINMQPMWEKPQKNESPQIKIEEDQNQLTQEVDNRDKTHRNLIRESKPVISAFSRPFGSSIFKLNQILMSVPKGFSPIYHQVHRKLIVDQINVQQQLQKQQKTMQNIKTLLALKKEQIQCEQYLVLKDPDLFSQQAMINKLLIKTMVRELAIKRTA